MLDTGIAGWVYLLHFIDPATGEYARFGHAGHYLGWARYLHVRLGHHGTPQGANLMLKVKEAGLGWELARVWRGSKQLERALKEQGGHSRKCPKCGVRPMRSLDNELRELLLSDLGQSAFMSLAA
jgi:hypothetical protein